MCLDSGHSGVDTYNNDQIDQRIFTFDNIYQQVLNNQSMLQLFVENKELMKSINDVKIAMLGNLALHPS